MRLNAIITVSFEKRRIKNYAGQTGFVYEYYFVGKRPALENDPEAPATEYIFDVSPDRKTTFSVSVFLSRTAVETWATTRGRTLADPEQYAAAKLRLLQAFDEVTDMLKYGRRLKIEAAALDELLASIGVD